MKKTLFIPLGLLLLISSCNKGENEDTTTNKSTISYVPTVLPSQIEQLYELRGDKTMDTVWVFLQGGPDFKMNYELEKESSQVEYDFFTDDLRVYPYQIQQLNTSLKTATDFTFEDALKESDLSVKIVKDVVTHFKNQNKVVYLIGHSYGAFLTQKVLADYGSIADRNAVLNCRLKVSEFARQSFKEGKFLMYDEKGGNPTVQNINEVVKKKT